MTSSFAVDELLYCIGTGRKHAKTARQLAWMMDISERCVCRLIEQARRDSYPIFADGDGYFLPDFNDPDDHRQFKRFLQCKKRKAETLVAYICVMENYYKENTYAF